MKQHCKFYLLVLSLFSFSFSLGAQDAPIIKYYDSNWNASSKDSAAYFTKFVKQDSFYVCYSYLVKTKKLYSKTEYADTLFSKVTGPALKYYDTGVLEDSTYYSQGGSIKNTFHYYPNGKLWAHYTYNKDDQKEFSEGFDENGKKIENFVYIKEATFPGGIAAWQAYLGSKVSKKVAVKNGAPNGEYQVIIRFIVDTKGRISELRAETNHGYGMEEEVIRVIKKSPRWDPLVLLGKVENAYRRQPLTFVVKDE